MPLNFDLVEVNPNDSTGGGGTLAAEMHDTDATGPFFVWPATEMDSGVSPYAVVAASEVRLMAAALQKYEGGELDVMAGGERTILSEPIEQYTGAGQGDAAREYDLNDTSDVVDFATFARGD